MFRCVAEYVLLTVLYNKRLQKIVKGQAYMALRSLTFNYKFNTFLYDSFNLKNNGFGFGMFLNYFQSPLLSISWSFDMLECIK